MSLDSVLHFGSYRLDVSNEQLWRDGQLVRLTPKAFQVLRALMDNSGQLVTKEELFQSVWADTVVSDAALTSCIQELRQALGDNARNPQYIETVHRRGFRFIGKVVSSQETGASREEDQKPALSLVDGASSENGLESSVQSLESEQHRQIVNGQTLDPLGDSELRSPTSHRLDTPAPVSQRFWSVRTLGLLSVGLLISILLAAYYVSRYIPKPLPELPLPDKPSLAVLPFANMSGDPAQEYFSDGITDDLITDLSQISSLFVIARYSSFTYKGKPTKVQEIGRELGVRYVLEGSVQKVEGRVRVNAQLVDATTGYHLWSERYDRPLAEIFAVQDEIRQQIVANLQVEMYEAEIARVQRIPTVDLTAYDFYLRGRAVGDRALFETNSGANAQARELFEKAIELDPHYASAYAQLGFTYWLAHFYGWEKDRAQALEQAFTLVQKAVVLDASLPAPHRILGQIYFWKRQYDRAISEMEQAIALNPNNADGYERLGNVLGTAGRPKEAISLIEKAMRLNPRYPSYYLVNLGIAYLADGRCEEALTPLKKVLTMTPDFTPAHTNLAICYAELGRLEEAKASAETVMRLNPQFSLDAVRRGAPIKDPALLERQMAALRKAGLK